MNSLPNTQLFGVKITNASEDTILKYVLEILQNKGKKVFITTPNPEIIMYAKSHPEFRKILNTADLALADGVGVTIAGRLVNHMGIKRVTGVDFMEKLSYKLSKSAYNAGFFGGQPGIAELTAECLQKKYSGLTVSYASDVWDERKLMSKNIDVLFVAMGFPKQEKWIYENLDKIPAKVVMGVGGSFDFISGKVTRSPKFLRKVGLEWLFRLVAQPWRWKRQLVLTQFLLLTISESVKNFSLKSSTSRS